MKRVRKRNKKVIYTFSSLIFISFTLFLIGFYNYLHPDLKKFEIINVVEKDESLYLNFSQSVNSIEYKIVCEDENNNIIFETKSDNNTVKLDNFVEENGKNYTFSVTAYNKKSESLIASNTYLYKSEDATIANDNEHYLPDNGVYILNIVGDITDYTLEMFYENNLISSMNVLDNSLIIPVSLFDNYAGKVTFKLKNSNGRVTSTFNVYANSLLVGNVNITNIMPGEEVDYNDLEIYYEGGINATNIMVNLYNNNKLETSYYEEENDGKLTIPASLFKENTSYTLELVACYKDYYEVAKKSTVDINVLPKETVKPVYVNKNFTYIKSGTEVELLTDTKNATIYYTLDGSTPNENSNLYTGPIMINSDATIKARAYRNYSFDSIITTFDFKVGDKPLTVYLSPSNQYANSGIKSAGYTNEMLEMNKIGDYLENYLKENGVIVYRNKPKGNIDDWLSESRSVKSDLHLAIHSNASTNHDRHGMEMYIDNENSKSYSIASNIYHNLYSIYPYKESASNGGIKHSNGSLGEANDESHKNSTLIEIAYHDNYNDAKWIIDNRDIIAKNIGDSILSFYNLK